MVGHQYIRVAITFAPNCSFEKQFKVSMAITIIEETRLTIIATLRDVLWNFSNIEAWRSWQRLVRD